MELFDKVVIITGASSGIGRACGPAFARRGAKIALLARSAGELNEAAAEMKKVGHRVVAIPTDITDPEAVQKAFETIRETYGRIDVLVNNAGRAISSRIAELPLEKYREILELNLIGTLNCLQTAVPVMREQGGGVILNINSMVSKLNIPTVGGYVSSKVALESLTHTARLELARDNIRVISVYPNVTRTNFFKNTIGRNESRQTHGQENRERNGLSAEFVAEKIVQAAIEEPRDQYMTTRDGIFGRIASLIAPVIDKGMARRTQG